MLFLSMGSQGTTLWLAGEATEEEEGKAWVRARAKEAEEDVEAEIGAMKDWGEESGM